MRLNRFNEATRLRDGGMLYSKDEAVDLMFFKAVYPDLMEDLKEYLDTIFVEFIDKEYVCAITKVNTRTASFDGSFFTRYRVTMTYKLEEDKVIRKLKTRSTEPEPKFNSIESYAEVMRVVSEDLLNLNSCVAHIKDEYENESIYGKPFPVNTFDTSVNMNMSSGELIVVFALDIK